MPTNLGTDLTTAITITTRQTVMGDATKDKLYKAFAGRTPGSFLYDYAPTAYLWLLDQEGKWQDHGDFANARACDLAAQWVRNQYDNATAYVGR